eukprot:6399826-Pyramimonas_sp.AAC.1
MAASHVGASPRRLPANTTCASAASGLNVHGWKYVMAMRADRSASPGRPRGTGAPKKVGALGLLFRLSTHV